MELYLFCMIRPLLCLALLGLVACELTQEQSKIPSSSSSLSSSLESSSSSLRTAAYSSPLEIAVQKDSLVDARDGERYAVLHIGAQTWMAENLRYDASLGEDSLIPNLGRKYHWKAAFEADSTHGSQSNPSTYASICPQGWHLPSLEEWYQMLQYVDLRTGVAPMSQALSQEPFLFMKELPQSYWLSNQLSGGPIFPYGGIEPIGSAKGWEPYHYRTDSRIFHFIRCAKDLP